MRYTYDNHVQDMNSIHFDEIDSTNNYAKRMIEEYRQAGKSLPDCTVISADKQTLGRGRSGKSFASPSGGSIYMTIVLKLNETADRCMMLTPAAAVGTLEAIEEAGSEKLGIKWVNDLFLGERKVCGILTEAIFTKDGSSIEYAVIGIGINIDLDIATLPEEIKSIAGSISGLKLSKPDMVANIAEHVRKEALASIAGSLDFMRIYRERSVLIGREIYWDAVDGRHTGIAKDINDSGNLLVDENNRMVTLMSGEVSVRRL